jgi:hypothetical protein
MYSPHLHPCVLNISLLVKSDLKATCLNDNLFYPANDLCVSFGLNMFAIAQMKISCQEDVEEKKLHSVEENQEGKG